MPTSDSEDDGDYVPPQNESHSDSEDEEREAKRVKLTPPPTEQKDPEAEKRKREAIWAEFQASTSSESASTPQKEVKMVKIEKTYRFAGDTVVKIEEVPEDSPDAKKWPRWTEPSSSVVEQEPAKQPPKRSGPRKSKLSLAALPSKAKRLSTLDKSAMDWQTHVADGPDQDELEANRRGGGYLEKVEFLQRVGDRKDEVLESSKGNKRRR